MLYFTKRVFALVKHMEGPMLKHRTDDPGQRASHIAEHEADDDYQRTGDAGKWFETMITVANQAEFELLGGTPIEGSDTDQRPEHEKEKSE